MYYGQILQTRGYGGVLDSIGICNPSSLLEEADSVAVIGFEA